ncbi:MAG: glycosyltransferase family 4 protein [Gammaproteobacteria bacterium]|nr:glycosyltransferase family 4 protein [Gammaproteobacteria bacterium]
MRILNVSSLYPPNVIGGAELGLQTIAEAMSDAGHEVHVVTLRPPERLQPADYRNDSRVTVHSVPLANVYWPHEPGAAARPTAGRLLWHGIDTANGVMARRVERIVRRVRPNVVLTHNLQGFSTAVMPAVKRTGVPLVHVPHDYALLCAQTALWRNGKGCGFRSDRCTGCRLLTAPRRTHVSSVDAVISVSRSLLDTHRLHGLFGDIPATVIYNALRPSFQIRNRVGERRNSDIFTFGYLGRIERSKGIETLLAAATELGATGSPFRLRIAGRGESDYLEYLRQRWPLDNVDYVGFVDSASFLGNIDTLVFPSQWLEALGNGVFEAFSQGVPVIGTHVGGIPESIDEGVTGFIYEPGNTQALIRCMARLLDDPDLRRRQGTAALTKAQEYLAPRRAAEYIEFLDRVLAQQQRNPAA